MLAYQPINLANVSVAFGQGLSAGKRILPIIDQENKILINENGKFNIEDASIQFKNINFSYNQI